MFVDELSAAARPLLGAGGTIPSGFAFETQLLQSQWQNIAGIGTPVKVYLLSDLLQPSFDNASIKMAVFSNAFMLGSEMVDAVRSKLQGAGQLLVWSYTPAIFDASACTGSIDSSGAFSSTCTPNMTAASDVVGMSLLINSTVAVPLTTTFSGVTPATGLPPPSLAGTSYGDTCGDISPHVTCGGGGSVDGRVGGNGSSVVSVIGRYATAAQRKAGKIPSMCHATHTDANYSSVFIGTPRPPLALWRALARSAGVHLYTSDSVSTDNGLDLHADHVEVSGAGLYYHAGGANAPSETGTGTGTAPTVGQSRVVTLPGKFAVQSEWGDEVCSAAAPCSSFATPPLVVGGNILYWLTTPAL